MKIQYPVAAPDLSGNESRYVNECLDTTWISSHGRFIYEFERQVADLTDSQYGVAAANGTAALHLALLALGVQPGDEVIVPSLTFVATANAVTYCGATPVFADCEPDTWCLAAESVERLLTPRTKGIIPVHLFGHPCDMDPLAAIARRHGLWIVEDCAEAIGATYHGRPVGSLGDLATFSFFGNKIITTGEGGMVVTNLDLLAERLRLFRGQGMDLERRYWHTVVGYNYRMSNIAAAIGVAQMERIGELLADRRQVAGWYQEQLQSHDRLTLPMEAPGVRNVYWMYSILVDRPQARDPLMAGLAQRGIETRPLFYPLHELPMYRQSPNDRGCPISRDVSQRGLSLPSSSYLREPDVEFICGVLRECLSAAQPLRIVA